MKSAAAILLAFLVALGIGCTPSPSARGPITLDELRITVSGPSRELGYTNKQAGFLYTETSAEHRTAWQGWHIMAHKMLDDYRICADTTVLRKGDVRETKVWPHQFMRRYLSGITETVTLLDSIDALVIELDHLQGRTVTIEPLFDWATQANDYTTETDSGIALVASVRHLQRTATDDYPVRVAVGSDGAAQAVAESLVFGRRFSPVRLAAAPTGGKRVFVLAAANDAPAARSLVRRVASDFRSLIAARQQRMERLLNSSFVRTDNARFDQALHWAMLSMDALVMHQVRKGIFAGLPWFDNYWGRDSFISLPGATLVTGHFDDAREILRSFATWQETDPESPNYGRIPNLVTPTSIAYNTADGTPWFVLALQDYVAMSGDTAFATEMYPVVQRSIAGTLRYHTDEHRLLVHGDAETWMDAVGPDGPWSPRGNRANDIQALWIRQLISASSMARSAGDESSAARWDEITDQAMGWFQQLFIDPRTRLVYDHLRADGTPDTSLRPNQLFTTDIVQNPRVRLSMFITVTEKLVYPYGVGSLSPDDPNFHPYHHYEPYYVQDAAYHQGIVWTWLAGRWIQTAVGYGLPNLAFQVTDNMVHQILDRGAVGTLSELTDAIARPGESEPRLSGTFSQAWSLAEFIRNTYQSYFGVTLNVPERQMTLFPRLPDAIHAAAFTVPAGNERIEIEYAAKRGKTAVVLDGNDLKQPFAVILGWPFDPGTGRMCSFTLAPGQKIELTLAPNGYTQRALRGDTTTVQSFLQGIQFEPGLNDVRLATAYIRPGLRCMQGPGHRLLSHAEVTVSDSAAPVLLDASDPAGDDVGTGHYTYPRTSSLTPGSLDLTHVRISADRQNVYIQLRFRALSNPGWHPEYGFQLTYAAICINKGSAAGRRTVGRNARYTLPPSYAYDDVIYVGGGIRVEDARDSVLAEYLPVAGDERRPIGDAAQGTITFAVPTEVIGTPDGRWRFAVLVGAQDDHGGSGIGDFRSVDTRAQEWSGGGRRSPADPNVYDTFFSH